MGKKREPELVGVMTPRGQAWVYLMRSFFPRLPDDMLDKLYGISSDLNDSPLRMDEPANWTQTFEPLPGLGECRPDRIGSRMSGWECVESDGVFGWTFIPQRLRCAP
jgi:hypothetical protein